MCFILIANIHHQKTSMKVISVATFLAFLASAPTGQAFSSFAQIGENVQGTAGIPDRVLPPNSNSPEPKKNKAKSTSIAPTLTGGLVSDAAGRRHSQDLPPNSQPKSEFFYPSKSTGSTKSFSAVKESKPNAKNIGYFFPPPKK